MMQSHRQIEILREFDVSQIRPRLSGLSHLEKFTWQNWPRLRGLPGLADGATRHVNVVQLKLQVKDCST